VLCTGYHSAARSSPPIQCHERLPIHSPYSPHSPQPHKHCTSLSNLICPSVRGRQRSPPALIDKKTKNQQSSNFSKQTSPNVEIVTGGKGAKTCFTDFFSLFLFLFLFLFPPGKTAKNVRDKKPLDDHKDDQRQAPGGKPCTWVHTGGPVRIACTNSAGDEVEFQQGLGSC